MQLEWRDNVTLYNVHLHGSEEERGSKLHGDVRVGETRQEEK